MTPWTDVDKVIIVWTSIALALFLMTAFILYRGRDMTPNYSEIQVYESPPRPSDGRVYRRVFNRMMKTTLSPNGTAVKMETAIEMTADETKGLPTAMPVEDVIWYSKLVTTELLIEEYKNMQESHIKHTSQAMQDWARTDRKDEAIDNHTFLHSPGSN